MPLRIAALLHNLSEAYFSGLILAAISHTDRFCGERWVMAGVEGD